MKRKPPQVGERVAPLTFAWKVSEAHGARLCLATVFAVAVFWVAWAGLRIVVPSSISGDGTRLREAQYLVLGEDSDPSLLRLLRVNEVPSLAVEESVGEAPLIDDLLSQLGLMAPEERRLDLYPAPLVVPELIWPQAAETRLTLPALPVVAELGMPLAKEASHWNVRLVPQGALGEYLAESEYPWALGGVTERQRELFVTLDQEGQTVVASLLGEGEPAMEAELRRLWEGRTAERIALPAVLSGVVAVEFLRREDDEG